MSLAEDLRPDLSPADFPDSPFARVARQPLMLGLFLPIQAGGWSASSLPRTTTWTFDYNAALVKRAEAAGFDMVFGLAQWLPKGGYNSQQNGEAIDAFIALAALTSITERIILVGTTHVLYGPWHPLHFAKYCTTLDHISKGRWGINIVTGHRAVEHEMFGWSRIEHDRRYELAGEFLDVVKRLWSENENYTYEGQSSWRLKDAFVTPKPIYGRPLLVNATGSDAGITFASKYSDVVFVTSPTGSAIESALESLPAHTARVKAEAAARGRSIKTLINPIVVCRETEDEAEAYADAIVANVDGEDAKGNSRFDSDAHAWRGRKNRTERRIGGNVEVVGSPEQVVDYFVRLKAAGIDGVQVSFFDFKPDLDFFCERVVPLMKEAGLRH